MSVYTYLCPVYIYHAYLYMGLNLELKIYYGLVFEKQNVRIVKFLNQATTSV